MHEDTMNAMDSPKQDKEESGSTEDRTENASGEERRDASGKKEERTSKKKKRRKSPVVGFLIKVVLLVAILASVFTFVLGIHRMRGYGMHPNIKDGDLVITYKLEQYHVGDAVVYRHPGTGKSEVARIVAIGTNEVQITEIGELLINGSMPDESVYYPTRPAEGSEVGFPYQMSEGGYFLLQDYRTEGSDSRTFGEITEDALQGKVVYVFRRRGI